jgi:hypothetical protein
MGYREIQPHRWAKPVGYHFLTCDELKRKLFNIRRDTAGEEILWETRIIPPRHFVAYISQFESETRLSGGIAPPIVLTAFDL